MELELNTRISASAPLRDSRSSTIGHISQDDGSNERKPDFKCWLCETSDHWIDQCKKVLSKTQEERFQLMKDNRACFSCLKRAGKDHNMGTCKRRKRCNEVINTGEQCSSYHHPLLHKQIETGSAGVASITGTPVLLPVLKIKMAGPNRNCEGNCLLDSGSQMSLVRNAVAEELGLKGNPIVANVTKVGNETEEYNTMLYKVKVQGINGHQSYTISAVGLDVINNGITRVSVEELGRMFNLRKDEIHRGSGPIDILIGMDHSKMHVGYTKIQGNLMARRSPLGWVIFGSTTEGYPEGAVLHVTVNSPLDLRKSLTTEGMKVCNDPQRCQHSRMIEQEDEEFRVISSSSSSCEKMEKQWLDQYPRRKDQSRHIPQNLNVADEVSRCVSLDKLNDREMEGLDFLCKTVTERPAEAKLEEKLPEVDRELRMERPVLTVQESKSQHRIDCQQFINWRKLVRVTSYVLKFIGKLKLKSKRMVDEDVEVANGNLTPTDIQKGEDHLIKRAQVSLKPRVDKGELKALNPYRNEAGIIRVRGKVDSADKPLAMKHPALLPCEHWISTSIIRHVHEDGHDDVGTTTAKARRKYWILRAHDLVKKVKFGCAACRTFEHKLESQGMAELQRGRLQLHPLPFQYSSCNYQRPICRIPIEPDEGIYLSPNDMLLGRASIDVAKRERHCVELVQRIVDSFWRQWTIVILPLLTSGRKWNRDRQNIRVDDDVIYRYGGM
ncbi:uncharacterized protein LOC121419541 [Lytechinus variegatus]|uniref:uncharacterized protein LOC121419541 n=1 Tax=Lytechinus variegatus TaxID=7654 RepID=UPI001BB1DD0F|nr:uncharacterized protein LOC121419541 [Lytechinus variegatus]